MPHPQQVVPPSPGTVRGALRAVGLLIAVCVTAVFATAAASQSSVGTTTHRVVIGDSLWSLAQQTHTTVARLQALNGLHTQTIQLGQVIQLPVIATTTTSGAATFTSSSVAYSRSVLAGRVIPTHLTIQGWIRSEALRQGVPPSLALAIAYQESGFSQSMVSPTDAVGVMQLEPDTASWVSTYLVGRPLDRYDAHDNVVAGVALLRNLLAQTDVPTAIAAYYQGLRAVQTRGLFTDTKQYVASVLALRPRFS